MFSRLMLALTALGLATLPAAAADLGGHPLEFGVTVGHMDFDDEIRFANDATYGITARLGFTEWLRLGLDLSQMTMRDTKREAWSEAVTFAMNFAVEPTQDWPAVPYASFGVSFMGFEETEVTDAISEGLDLGLGWRWAPSPRWNIRAELLSRMQTFRLIPITPTGELLPTSEETGYLWSRVWVLGLTHVF